MVPQLSRLDAELRRLCPIDGVNSDGVIAFSAGASLDQRLAAQALVDGWNGLPPTKDERIAHTLATMGKGRDRTTIQLAILVGEMVLAPAAADYYGVSLEIALMGVYARNKTYRESKDCEAVCQSIEAEPS
jgi:hypothetical protein